jgi:hypothetical protein
MAARGTGATHPARRRPRSDPLGPTPRGFAEPDGVWALAAVSMGVLMVPEMAVSHVDDALRNRSDVGSVGDQDDGVSGLMEATIEREQLTARFGVEVACGLVRKDHGRKLLVDFNVAHSRAWRPRTAASPLNRVRTVFG